MRGGRKGCYHPGLKGDGSFSCSPAVNATSKIAFCAEVTGNDCFAIVIYIYIYYFGNITQ